MHARARVVTRGRRCWSQDFVTTQCTFTYLRGNASSVTAGIAGIIILKKPIVETAACPCEASRKNKKLPTSR